MKLEKVLILYKFMLNLFGFKNFYDLKNAIDPIDESINNDRYFIDILIRLKPEWHDRLLQYYSNIKEYIEKLKKNRQSTDFTLKYFQYFAVLFTEIFLDLYYHDNKGFISKLNDYLEQFNKENGTNITEFTDSKINKLAYWMATGSGKTIIMHINYWQILKYIQDWDNILLITPNEGLSKQHYKELKRSGIPCKIYTGNVNDLSTKDNEILIIDIYKLTKKKKGTGVSVDINSFKGKNLVFIDEGHKGQKSEEQTWKNLRENIGREGFLFEYSATFGQIIGNNEDILNEYAKAIIFDYSYKYFYNDGYGKDFYIYNINRKSYTKEERNILFVSSLLSFYEKLKVYDSHKDIRKKYNIEKPLWIFIGSKVSGRGINSDIIEIIKFFNTILSDKKFLEKYIEKILNKNTYLINENGEDIFSNLFISIRGKDYDIAQDIYETVFNGYGNLELYIIKNSEGEIALKTSTSDTYFGIINIGNINSFIKLVKEKFQSITINKDYFNDSLFFKINEPHSMINILIGSKKFIEGWNSWRVSNIGLLNIGKSEGPQIIQLFGRGVRLKGQNFSLKREITQNYELKILQTLFIFGLNAKYITSFLNVLDKEDVNYAEISIPIKFSMNEKWENRLYIIETKDDFKFMEIPTILNLRHKLIKEIELNLNPSVQVIHGFNVNSTSQLPLKEVYIPDKYIDLVDWESIYLNILEFKQNKKLYNLILDENILKKIIKSKQYKIYLQQSEYFNLSESMNKYVLTVRTFEGINKLQNIFLTIIKRYIMKFYRWAENRAIMKNLTIKPLLSKNPKIFPKEIKLKIPKDMLQEFTDLIEQLKQYTLKKNPANFLEQDYDKIPTIVFKQHLYVPLVIFKEGKEKINSMPVKLNKGESKFIGQLREFFNTEREIFKDKEMYVLRNLSKKGIYFFINSGFYPDFIIWVLENNVQKIIFVDPKGIQYLYNFNDDKIKICTKYIKDIEQMINNKKQSIHFKLYSFIVSIRPYDEIKPIFGNGNHSKKEFRDHNILFQNEDYIKAIFDAIN